MRREIVVGGLVAAVVASGVTIAVTRDKGSSLPAGRIALPSKPPPTGGIFGVGMGGKLHYDGRCLYLDFGAAAFAHKVSLVWPPGWTFDPSTGLLYDPDGRVSGKTGEVLQGGGMGLGSGADSSGPVPKSACVTAGSTQTFNMLDVEVDPYLTKRYPQS